MLTQGYLRPSRVGAWLTTSRRCSALLILMAETGLLAHPGYEESARLLQPSFWLTAGEPSGPVAFVIAGHCPKLLSDGSGI
ncbi:MAG: hypothetical protein JWO49_2754 [Arthrobacter sp.]|nr:hypothetical protein [Arthrobacter sp.]